ncbi:MAG: alpha/beta fold hydrolase [Myxococcota bacterium]
MAILTRDGCAIFHESRGEGPAVVLVHGFLFSDAIWEAQARALVEAGHRVITVDLRGHGRSGAVELRPSLYDLTEDVLAVLDAHGVDRAVWGGLSMGGMIALRAALRAPKRVAAMMLLDTDAGPERLGVRLKHRVLALVARLFGLAPVREQILALMFGRTTLRDRPALVDDWRARLSENHVPSMLAVLHALDTRDDLRPRLGSIDVPALVLVGAEDRALPPSRSRALAAALPDAELHVLREAGHMTALEVPDETTERMLAFLGRLR